MSHFTLPFYISLADNEDDGEWVLMADLLYESDIAGSIIVPKGFKTDLASVPRIPFAYEVDGNHANLAGIVHDYLYSVASLDRKTCDDVFYEACLVSGVSKWRAWSMWLAIRMFGAAHYGS